MSRYRTPEFLNAVAKAIGVHPEDLEERRRLGIESEEDTAAFEEMSELVREVVRCRNLHLMVTQASSEMTDRALSVLLSVPPEDEDEDVVQRILRHCADIKRIGSEL